MSCQAGPGIEPGSSALKASALPIELTWQVYSPFSDRVGLPLHNILSPFPSVMDHHFRLSCIHLQSLVP